MGDLSRDFDRQEFACRCGKCGFNTVDYELLVHLQYERAHFGSPIVITSGCRCYTHNKAVGGADHSQHLLGRACDHYVVGVPIEEQWRYFESRWPGKYGLAAYLSSGFLHFDTRSNRARWGDLT